MEITRETIVDAALRQADRTSWESVRLHDVAAELSTTLDAVRAHFREKEDIVDAWFDRADGAMLREAANVDYSLLTTARRLERAMLAWLGALSSYRRVTRQMVANKLEPGHFHYQWNGALRISRTVQWWREAAGRDTVLPWRAFEETALTGLYLAAFLYWMYDDSPGASRTQSFLRRRLEAAARIAQWIAGPARRSTIHL